MVIARRQLHLVSSIQAHNSPVLIIQRFIRGHLARCRFRLTLDQCKWAANTSQGWWGKDGGQPKEEKAEEKAGEAAEKAEKKANGSKKEAESKPEDVKQEEVKEKEGNESKVEEEKGKEKEEIAPPEETPRPPSVAHSEGASTVVKGPTSVRMSDIYPIFFYDGTGDFLKS